MTNREHTPTQTRTLRAICAEGGLRFPISDEIDILVEAAKNQQEDIYRNFPGRSYSTRTAAPREIVELLAYEGHEWQAYEVLRTNNTYKFPLVT